MEITVDEARRIERLRKQLRQWRFYRWLVLSNAVLTAALCTFTLWFFVNDLHEQHRQMDVFLTALKSNQSKAPSLDTAGLVDVISIAHTSAIQNGYFAVFFVFWMVFAGLGVAQVVILARDWHGKTEQVLLLKLYDAQRGSGKVTGQIQA